MAHPRVVWVENNLDRDISIVAHVNAGLGSRWQADGVSPNGVQLTEPITVRFSEHYPSNCPDISLRSDFDRSHPHLLPGSPDEPPRPCYIDGHPHDFLRLRGMHGVISQVADWLEKAASAELISPIQGWEPVRRDRLDDYVEADADILRALVDRDGGGVFFRAPFTMIGDSKSRSICCHVLERLQLRENVAKTLFSQYNQIGIAVVVWPGRSPTGEEVVASTYAPETVTNVQELYERAGSLGLSKQLQTYLGLVRTRLKSVPSGVPTVIAVALLVRRPFEVIGQGSRIEILPYVMEVSNSDDLAPASLSPVRLAAHRDAISPKLLSTMAGRKIIADPPKWTLLGAGSVGSKLAIHLAREGRGPGTVIDSSLMRPHNYSRHGLLPLSRFDALNDVKAQALSHSVRMLGQASTGYYTDVAWLASAGTDEEWKGAWPRGTQFLVDATGSPSVTDALCLSNIVRSRPRVVETSLFAGGRIAYFGLEGTGINPNVQDLAAESYRIFANDDTLRGLAFNGSGELVPIGQGCSTLTARMSDAMLSAPIPAMAKKFSNLLDLDEVAPEGSGEIMIGVVEEDLLGQSWRRDKVEAFIKLKGDDPSAPSVRISRRVASIIDETIEAHSGVETGGVLIGRFNESTNSFHVVDLIRAPSDSKFTATLFSLGTAGLAERIAEYVDRSHGTLYPIGTWHNHLSDSAASRTDLATGVQLAFGQRFPAVILIRTPSVFHGLVVEAADAEDTNEPAVMIARISEEEA
ncbi:hypothetical protein [Rhizobium rhizogenes]|nr:hypothetical protein [Rhizobium rhizogenes]